MIISIRFGVVSDSCRTQRQKLWDPPRAFTVRMVRKGRGGGRKWEDYSSSSQAAEETLDRSCEEEGGGAEGGVPA